MVDKLILNHKINQMKKLVFYTFFMIVGLCLKAQETPEKVCFNANHEFKIAQFTDMHLAHDKAKNRIVKELIKEILDTEKPDLVVFTGDNTTMDEVEQGWSEVAEILSQHQTPWTAVLGNHDDEHAVRRPDIIKIIQKQPYCILRDVTQGIKGEGNHIVPIYAYSNPSEVAAAIYCLDSNAYSTVKGIDGYGWFDRTQINWYAEKSHELTQENNSIPLPALAFFHIPLQEYSQAWASMDSKRYGTKDENECWGKLNSGIFANMVECGDVMGIFVGHDHVNDYIAMLHNIALGYGRASGGTNTYGDKTPGSRIIVLKEGKRTFSTWIHEKGSGNRIDVTTYPTSFLKKK